MHVDDSTRLAVAYDPALSDKTARIYQMLTGLADTHGRFEMSHDAITRQIGVHRSSLHTALQQLTASGWLSREVPKDRSKPTRFQLHTRTERTQRDAS